MTLESEQNIHNVMRRYMEDSLQMVGVSMPGNVLSYNRAKQTAKIRPGITQRLRAYTDEEKVFFDGLPDLPNVPVIWPCGDGPGGGGDHASYFHPNLAVGAGVLVIASDADITQWRKSGRMGNPIDDNFHSYDNCFAIPGLNPKGQALPSGIVRLAVNGTTYSVALAERIDTILSTLLSQLQTIGASPAPTVTPAMIATLATALQTAIEANDTGSIYAKVGG